MRSNAELARELDELRRVAILDGDEELLIEECAARLRADDLALQAATALTEKAVGGSLVGALGAADAALLEKLRGVFGEGRAFALATAISDHVDAKVLAFGAMIMEKLGVQPDE